MSANIYTKNELPPRSEFIPITEPLLCPAKSIYAVALHCNNETSFFLFLFKKSTPKQKPTHTAKKNAVLHQGSKCSFLFAFSLPEALFAHKMRKLFSQRFSFSEIFFCFEK